MIDIVYAYASDTGKTFRLHIDLKGKPSFEKVEGCWGTTYAHLEQVRAAFQRAIEGTELDGKLVDLSLLVKLRSPDNAERPPSNPHLDCVEQYQKEQQQEGEEE